MAKSPALALLAFALAGLAVMAAPSSEKEAAPISEQLSSSERVALISEETSSSKEEGASISEESSSEEEVASVSDESRSEEHGHLILEEPSSEEGGAPISEQPSSEEEAAAVSQESSSEEGSAAILEKPSSEERSALISEEPSSSEEEHVPILEQYFSEEEVAPVQPPEMQKASEELKDEDNKIDSPKDKACPPLPLFVLHEIKEQYGWFHNGAEGVLTHFFMILNRNNTEEARADFNCMLHLLIGTAGFENMEEVLSLYTEHMGSYFSEVTQGLKELRSRMMYVLYNENPAPDSDIEKWARKYISLGLEMKPPRNLLESYKHEDPEPFGPDAPGVEEAK